MSDNKYEVALSVFENGDSSYSDWVRDNCPFCITRIGKDDRRASFGVRSTDGFFHCFRCGVKGKLQGDQFDDLLDESEYFKKDEQAEVQDITPPYSYTPLWLEPGLSSESLAPARSYLTSRGYSLETWEACGIGACYKSYFDERVVIPIIEEGKWKGFVARDWSGRSVRKYLYPIGMNRSELMWQRHLLSVETSSPILVVEGVFDALPYLGHAVACLGKPSRKQVEQLKCSRRPLVIVLDGDAWEEGKALSQVLSLSGVKSAYIKLDAGEDPGSVDSGWLLNEAFNRVS